MCRSILVIAAHPDDEALGCGGVMIKHSQAGDKVYTLFLADGETSRNTGGDIGKRQEAANNAAEILGSRMPVYLSFADNRLDHYDLLDIVQPLEREIQAIDPEIIYTHHGEDLNIDHRVTHQAVLTACRPQPGSKLRAIYTFEVLSSTEWASTETSFGFRPLRYVDVTDFLHIKVEALKCYDAEMRPYPHARSYETVKSLAQFRGASVGLRAAEAFGVIREVVV